MHTLSLLHPMRAIVILLGLASALYPHVVLAHAPGENYVWLNIDPNGISGRFEINMNDLKAKLGIEWTEFGSTREEAISASAPQVQTYLTEHFRILIDGQPLALEFGDTALFGENGEYAQYYYSIQGVDVPDRFTIYNDIFISSDTPLHRSLIALEYNRKLNKEYGAENGIMAFGPFNPEQELDLTDLPALLNPRDFIWQGILHIWIGTDHILFLTALLLPAVLVFQEKKWEAVPDFRTAIWNVLKIVTLFTVAHSITLSLAALGFIDLSSRIVESLIALSIVVVAMNNIFPKFNDRTWLVIFSFGLFHGMGFASVMGVLPFRTIGLMKILLAFNIGVELGQLAIVAGIFPLIYLLRKSKFYKPVVVTCGSFFIALVAAWWFFERAFEL